MKNDKKQNASQEWNIRWGSGIGSREQQNKQTNKKNPTLKKNQQQLMPKTGAGT